MRLIRLSFAGKELCDSSQDGRRLSETIPRLFISRKTDCVSRQAPVGNVVLGKNRLTCRIGAYAPGGTIGEDDMQPKVHLKANDTILFTGDSITAAERHQKAYRPLGFGYVHFAGNFLLAGYPKLNLHIMNTGVSGDTVIDLRHRWERDCLAHQPDVLSVLIGINDVWQLTMEPDLAQTAATPDEYELTYDQLLAQARQQCGCQLVLMEPFMFCRDPHDRVFRALTPYIEIVRRLAAKHKATAVFLQRELDALLAEVPPERWSEDAVHPCLWAHAWIAQRWLEATRL